VKKREELGFDKDVAVVRIEQVAPFPFDLVTQELNKYKNAEIHWLQEEPKNMGFYDYCKPRIRTTSQWTRRVHYTGREPAASPATGSARTHVEQTNEIFEAAFRDL